MNHFIHYDPMNLILNISMIKAVSYITQPKTNRAGRTIEDPYGVVITYEGREEINVLGQTHKKDVTTTYFFNTVDNRSTFFHFLVQELTWNNLQ